MQPDFFPGGEGGVCERDSESEGERKGKYLVTAAMPAQGRMDPEHPNAPSDDGAASPSDGPNPDVITICRTDVRKEMQCPICLGIIRKTRTVMECLHRFCRECIDKSMRLGNNECPACRTHCASRRSLRDDPNFDALVAVIYPDIDEYEEHEMALLDEEARVNRQIQANIADTFKRQSDAIARRRTTAKATAAAIVRKAHGKFRSVQSRHRGRGRGRGGARGSRYAGGFTHNDEDEDFYVNERADTATSGDERPREPGRKRHRSKAPVSGYSSEEENSDNEPLSAAMHEREEGSTSPSDDERSTESIVRDSDGGASPANEEALKTWARAGVRSHTRYGSISGGPGNNVNNRSLRSCSRSKDLVDALEASALTEIEDEFIVHLSLQPLNDGSDDEDTLPSLKRPNLCCPPNMTIQQICEFLAARLLPPPEAELEILVEGKTEQVVLPKPPQRLSKLSKGKAWTSRAESGKEVMLLSSGQTVATVLCDFWDYRRNLELLYRRKN